MTAFMDASSGLTTSNHPNFTYSRHPHRFPCGVNPSELTAVNGQIVFAAEGNVYGRELWRSDGTKNGTKLLLDINPGGLDSTQQI